MKVELGKYNKAIVGGLGVLSVVLTDGVLDAPDLVTVALAVLAGLGVYAIPNKTTAEKEYIYVGDDKCYGCPELNCENCPLKKE